MSRVLITRHADKGLSASDDVVVQRCREVANGPSRTIATLGRNLYKVRVPIPGRGRSGGARIIVVYRKGSDFFVVASYLKNEKDSLEPAEKSALQNIGKKLLEIGGEEIQAMIASGTLRKLDNE